MKHFSLLVKLTLILFGLPGIRSAASDRQALLDQWGTATIRVKLETSFVIEIQDRKTPRSRPLNILGAVLTSSGLVAVPLSQIQPTISGPSTSSLSEIKYNDILLYYPGATAVPGRFVVSYPDDDLAFLAPVTPLPGLANHFSPTATETAVPLLDACYVLGSTLNGTSWIRTIELVAPMQSAESPVPILISWGHPGAAVVSPNGQLIGLCIRATRFNSSDGFHLMPSSRLLQLVDQAQAAK